ncbi:SMI1/KNR4 family protein [Pseudomonas brassicacearum]
MKYHLTEGEFNDPAESEILNDLSTHSGMALPKSYIDFLKQHNGGEGFIGEYYIVFGVQRNWPTSIGSMK